MPAVVTTTGNCPGPGTSRTGTAGPPGPGRRSDAGTVRFTARDITGLVLAGEMYGAPYDLLAAALGVKAARLRAPQGEASSRMARTPAPTRHLHLDNSQRA